jgi:hypothetical protein
MKCAAVANPSSVRARLALTRLFEPKVWAAWMYPHSSVASSTDQDCGSQSPNRRGDSFGNLCQTKLHRFRRNRSSPLVLFPVQRYTGPQRRNVGVESERWTRYWHHAPGIGRCRFCELARLATGPARFPDGNLYDLIFEDPQVPNPRETPQQRTKKQR